MGENIILEILKQSVLAGILLVIGFFLYKSFAQQIRAKDDMINKLNDRLYELATSTKETMVEFNLFIKAEAQADAARSREMREIVNRMDQRINEFARAIEAFKNG